MSESLYLVIKVSKRAKKCQKKPQIGLITRFPKKMLSWQIWNALIAKILLLLCNFRSYFFPLCEFKGPFSRLLTRANKYRKILSEFFYQINHRALSIGIPKYPENWWFYVVKLQKFGPKMAILDPETF